MARKLTGAGKLRLAYQSFGQAGGMEPYQSALVTLVRETASPDADIEVLTLQSAIVEGKGFASAQALEVPALLGSIEAAVANGAEAVAIGNGFDPGLWEARELFEVPILGLFETSALFALRLGWKIGVLCSGAPGISRVEEMIARYGLATRYMRPRAVGIGVPAVVAAFSDPAKGADLIATAEVAIDELASAGAEVVIVASGALDVFLQTTGYRSRGGIPVLPAVKILVCELELAARIARMGVPGASRAGRFAQPPPSIMQGLRVR